MKKTKSRLKKKYRNALNIVLAIILFLILGLMFKKGINDFEELARQCDQDRGYYCSYYEVRQYSLGK